jgi:hypothetical protein
MQKKNKTQSMDTIDVSNGELKHSGAFQSNLSYTVAGTANIFLNGSNYILQLNSAFTSSGGPDLKVYLSKEINPVNFINLGALKSVKDAQTYTITGTPNFAEYKYVLIYCQQFSRLFGYATLK